VISAFNEDLEISMREALSTRGRALLHLCSHDKCSISRGNHDVYHVPAYEEAETCSVDSPILALAEVVIRSGDSAHRSLTDLRARVMGSSPSKSVHKEKGKPIDRVIDVEEPSTKLSVLCGRLSELQAPARISSKDAGEPLTSKSKYNIENMYDKTLGRKVLDKAITVGSDREKRKVQRERKASEGQNWGR
jgi:hypothetical protein